MLHKKGESYDNLCLLDRSPRQSRKSHSLQATGENTQNDFASGVGQN